MKRIAFLLLAASLSGCLVVTPAPAPQPPALEVLSTTYATNYQTPEGAFVICDNLTTTLVYRFSYKGELDSWTSYLKGQVLDETRWERTWNPDSAGVSPYETSGFEVTYTLGEGAAPYQNGNKGGVSSDAIDIVPIAPPTVIGATKLYLILEGADGESRPYSSQDIPVVINCRP